MIGQPQMRLMVRRISKDNLYARLRQSRRRVFLWGRQRLVNVSLSYKIR